jgi:HAD superfamily hydrolase (TIGR01459 family)
VAALQAYRAQGGTVIMVTNAPRAHPQIAKQLDRLGMPRDAWDAIASSGDSARAAMFRGAGGSKVYFMGYESDLTIFEPMQVIENPVEITRVPLAEAEGIVCAGPFDPLADPETYRPDLLFAKQKNLPLLCFNPDIVVDVGEERQWCAGKVAEVYTEMGGRSFYFGKPHPPIYDLARRRIAGLGKDIADSRILCVGDGILTDVAGAVGEDLDVLFITGGLAAAETQTRRQPDPEALRAYLAQQDHQPTFSVGFLR